MTAPADAADALRAFGLTYPEARELPFVQPTGYGLGKSGWVTASWPDGVDDPMALFRAWIDESYRAQAPRRLGALAPAP